MDATTFRDTIVQPALMALDSWSLRSEQLMMGTAAQESQLIYTEQIGGGPALGYFQMEPATHDDCWVNYIDFRPALKSKVLAIRAATGTPRAVEMKADAPYAAAMARVRYMRVPANIPDDPREIAEYWKLYYNTPLGAGTVNDFIGNWNKLLAPDLYAKI
jgi:hypothetical protein